MVSTMRSKSARSEGSESRRRERPASPAAASSRGAKPWKVRISGMRSGSSERASRARSSPTARRENVNSKISDGATASASNAKQRATMTRVLPDPGTASTSTFPFRKATASRCIAVNAVNASSSAWVRATVLNSAGALIALLYRCGAPCGWHCGTRGNDPDVRLGGNEVRGPHGAAFQPE